MGICVATSWAATFANYMRLLFSNPNINPDGKSGLALEVDFNNPKRIIGVDMESITLNS